MALPNAACPRLLQKPLNAAIGQLLATYCSSGRQGNRQTNNNQQIHLKKVAVLMAMAMRRHVIAHIARWRRSRASLEATGRHHWASIMSDNINRTWLRRFFFRCLHHQNHRRRSQVDAKTHVFNRGMTYQSKWKGLTKLSI
jgi:hypothetical protein